MCRGRARSREVKRSVETLEAVPQERRASYVMPGEGRRAAVRGVDGPCPLTRRPRPTSRVDPRSPRYPGAVVRIAGRGQAPKTS